MNQFYASLLCILCCLSAYPQSYYANGDAVSEGGYCYRLTSANGNENGSVWYKQKIDLQENFDLEFDLYFGTKDSEGADGIVFVLQNEGNQAIGAIGGGLGFTGFSPSLGVEFDDFQNTGYGDPSYDHLSIQRDGNLQHGGSNELASQVQASATSGNIEDGQWHIVRIVWNAGNHLFQVYFDCVLRTQINHDIQKEIFNGTRYVYWGFTAATGGKNNIQKTCLRDDILVPDSVSLCKGGEIRLNCRESKDGKYRWWPGEYLNDTTIKSPLCTATEPITYYVEILDRCDKRIIDTIKVHIDQPFSIDEVQDTLLCDNAILPVDLRNKYDRVKWKDGPGSLLRFIDKAGYYHFRVWKGVCYDDDSMQITKDLSPELKIESDSFFCENEQIELKLSGKPETASHFWNTGSTEPAITISSGGTYYAVASNECGKDSAAMSIRKIVIPPIQIMGDSVDCPPSRVKLWVDSIPGLQYRWNTGANSASIQVDAGIYEILAFDRDCERSDKHSVFSYPTPHINLLPFYRLCDDELMEISLDQALVSQQWSTGDTGTSIKVQNISGDQWVSVFNQCGWDSASFYIELILCNCNVYAPNAFTPNDDAINNEYHVVADCEKMQEFHLEVYNRWGERVYESSDITAGWDGTYKDVPLMQGVYMYVLYYTGVEGGRPVQKRSFGTISLLR